MVSLGRVVAAPKPINLPSQRFEHDPTSTLMNDPSIKLVNRGSNGGGGGSKDSLENNNSTHQNEESNSERAKEQNLPERASWGKSWGSGGDGELGNSWNHHRGENNTNYSNNNANYRNGGGTNGNTFHNGSAGSKADTSDDWRRRDHNHGTNENNDATTNGGTRVSGVKREIQHEVAGAIANLHIPQGDWGEDEQMDFSNPPLGGFQTTKKGSRNSVDGGESSDTKRSSNQRMPEARNVKILQKPKKKEK